MGTELELKFGAPDAQTLEAILRDPAVTERQVGPVRTLQMTTQYFDTADGALAARHWTLRLRQENDQMVATLKTPAAQQDGFCVRGEWACAARKLPDAIPALIRQGAPQALKTLAGGGLREICGAAFTRRAATLRLPGGVEAELALDLGELRGGARRTALCEVELERLTGEPAAMARLAEYLASRWGLWPEARSKFARARELSDLPNCVAFCAEIRQNRGEEQ